MRASARHRQLQSANDLELLMLKFLIRHIQMPTIIEGAPLPSMVYFTLTKDADVNL